MKKVLFLLVLCGLLKTTAFAANFSGRWVMTLTSITGAGSAKSTLRLSQAQGYVIGTLAPAFEEQSTGSPQDIALHDIRVDGDTISFYVWSGVDRPQKQFFRGTMDGESIHFSVSGGADYYLGNPEKKVERKSIEVIAVREL